MRADTPKAEAIQFLFKELLERHALSPLNMRSAKMVRQGRLNVEGVKQPLARGHWSLQGLEVIPEANGEEAASTPPGDECLLSIAQLHPSLVL